MRAKKKNIYQEIFATHSQFQKWLLLSVVEFSTSWWRFFFFFCCSISFWLVAFALMVLRPLFNVLLIFFLLLSCVQTHMRLTASNFSNDAGMECGRIVNMVKNIFQWQGNGRQKKATEFFLIAVDVCVVFFRNFLLILTLSHSLGLM